MPKLIKVKSRTLRYGDKQMGRGGEYTVDDYFAKQCEIDGSAEVVRDLGEDESSKLPSKILDYKFLSTVKHHVAEIMEILKAETTRQNFVAAVAVGQVTYSDEDAKASDIEREVEVNQPLPSSAVDNVPSEKIEEIGTSSEKLSPIDELGALQATADNSNSVQSTLIPEDFPGFTALKKKEITTMEQLSQFSYDDLLEKGIRQGTANQIGAKLMELKESNA